MHAERCSVHYFRQVANVTECQHVADSDFNAGIDDVVEFFVFAV